MAKKKQIPKVPPFNPLDKRQLGESVADALLRRDVSPLPPNQFIGAGIYAIYYTGSYEQYLRVSASNQNGEHRWPLYVGKAVPAGARKGGLGPDIDPGHVLFSRLSEHAKSIGAASNLEIADFCCQYLVVDDIWIPLAESLLVETFHPLWNIVIDGFGNHDPGRGRYNQQKSAWDTIHPGREWADRLAQLVSTEEEICSRAAAHLDSYQSEILSRDST